MNNAIAKERVIATLNRLERFARITDSQYRIPFTNSYFGLDALIGLIPLVGEVIGLLMSGYILLEADKLEVPRSIKVRMLRNILIDFVIGLIPFIGDIADVAYKANIRNMRLLAAYIEQKYQITNRPPAPERPHTLLWIVLVILMALATGLFLWYSGAIEAFL